MTDTIDNSTPSLADLAEAIERRDDLPEARRKTLLSAIRVTARLLDRSPRDLPANAPALRARLQQLHPVQAGMSAKRLANIRSDLVAALRFLPTSTPGIRRDVGLTPAWRALHERLESPWQRCTLARLARYCSARRIAPDKVTDEVIDAFERDLGESQLAKDPAKVAKITVRTWNGFAERCDPSLPRLASRSKQRITARPLDIYPESFRDDLGCWIKRLRTVDFYDDDAPPKALRPTSLRNIEAHVRQFASALVDRGRDPATITGLTDLVEFEAFKDGFRQLRGEDGQSRKKAIPLIAASLLAIARHHVKLPPEAVERLKKAKAKLGKIDITMTDKNKQRLAQFDDPRNYARLVMLPEELAKEARRSSGRSSRDAVLFMHAVAIDLLLTCPIRIANLAGLDLDRHLAWHGDKRKKRLSLAIPAAEVKNSQPIEADLPPDTERLVREWRDEWRHLVSDAPGSWLFPKRAGGAHRSPGNLGQTISEVIWRRTGLRMNAHLFRHLAGMQYLAQRPGEYETVRKLLGHRSMQTTIAFYAGLESREAMRRYDEEVLSRGRWA